LRGITLLNINAEITKDPFFDLIQSLTIDFMEMSFADNGVDFRPDSHTHHWFDISFVMKGTVHYDIDGRHYCVSEGQLVIVAPGKIHRETASPGSPYEVMFLCLKFSRDGQPFDLAAYLDIKEVHLSRNREIRGIFENLLHEIAYREQGYLLKLNALIYHLLVEIRRGEARNLVEPEMSDKSVHLRKEKMAHDIKRYLETHLNQKISLQQLSETFFLSIPYISSLFKRQTGYSPVEYINKLRIDKAKSLLFSGYAVNEVWEKVGYGNIHYFYKVFKQVENMTPVQYLKSMAAQQTKIE
jgi:AraC-like DNA-binding protein